MWYVANILYEGKVTLIPYGVVQGIRVTNRVTFIGNSKELGRVEVKLPFLRPTEQIVNVSL